VDCVLNYAVSSAVFKASKIMGIRWRTMSLVG